MKSYIYPLSTKDFKEFESSGMIDLSKKDNQLIDFEKYDGFFVFDKERKEIMGPFSMYKSIPKDYLGHEKMISSQILCSMDSPIYHMEWDYGTGEINEQLSQFLETEIHEIDQRYDSPSITGDYMLDGLLYCSSYKDNRQFKGFVLTFDRKSPLIGYFYNRLRRNGIECEAKYNEIRITGCIDEKVLEINPYDYSWNMEFMIGLFAQGISKLNVRSSANTPSRYTYVLTVTEDYVPLDVIINQKQALFVHFDSYDRPCLSNMSYGVEPLNLLDSNDNDDHVDKTKIVGSNTERFSLALKVLENIFTFNGCHIVVEDLKDDLALLSIRNEKESKKAIIVRSIDKSLAQKTSEYDINDSGIIIVLEKRQGATAPSWIHYSDLDNYLEGRMDLFYCLGLNPILDIDPAISDALSDKLDLIWQV